MGYGIFVNTTEGSVMDKYKLKEALRLHQLWLNGDASGKRADLSWADLSGADLYWANLSYSFMLYYLKTLPVEYRDFYIHMHYGSTSKVYRRPQDGAKRQVKEGVPYWKGALSCCWYNDHDSPLQNAINCYQYDMRSSNNKKGMKRAPTEK